MKVKKTTWEAVLSLEELEAITDRFVDMIVAKTAGAKGTTAKA